jgi:hypothetical protein
MTRIRFEWREMVETDDHPTLRYVPGPERSREVDWPTVPRVGEVVDLDPDSGENQTVKVVMWSYDGEAVVRLR